MVTKLNDFLTKIGEGVKPNMFVVDINFPTAVTARPDTTQKDLINLLCKSAALPASNLGVIEVPFRGRTVKIAGDRTFDTWTATFFNDKDMQIRGFFEKWLEDINSHETNNGKLFRPSSGAEGYMATVVVKQMRKDDTISGSVLRQYDLMHCFPTNVSQIDLAYDSNDQIEEFTVEFQYSYWKAGKPTNAGTLASEVANNSTGINIDI